MRVAAWATSLLFTWTVEVGFGLWLLRRLPRGRVAATLAGGTAMTHPLLWWVLPWLIRDAPTFLVVGEGLVVVVEAAVLRLALPVDGREALSTSLLVNGASYLGGLLLRAAGLWPVWGST